MSQNKWKKVRTVIEINDNCWLTFDGDSPGLVGINVFELEGDPQVVVEPEDIHAISEFLKSETAAEYLPQAE